MAGAPAPYQVIASNLSASSENRIHDDHVARSLGFTGALVPGVEVYAYACHPIVGHFGRAWLDHGRAVCDFRKPVYDGRLVTVTVSPKSRGDLQATLESDGVLCATVTAALDGPATAPLASDFAHRALPAERPPAGESVLAVGTWLGSVELDVTPERAEAYLAGIREPASLYRAQRLVHPGQILRLCNQTLIENVVLGVWIHTGSEVQHHSAAHWGETLSVRAKVVANEDRRGHRCVDLDCLVLAAASQPVARVKHTAIYRLRAREP